MIYFLAFFSLFVSAPCFSAGEFNSPPDLAIGSMIASLLLVITCIFVFAFLMKKTNLLQNRNRNSLIKMISSQSLNNKGRVQIIEVNNKRYLLGVTEQNISCLDTFDIPEDEKVENIVVPINSFSALFSKISKQRNE